MPPGWGLPQVHQGPAHGAGARGLVSDTSGLSLFLLHTQLFPSSVKFWEKKKKSYIFLSLTEDFRAQLVVVTG